MKNRYWSKEEKLRIIKRVLENYESTLSVSKSENISNELLNNWIQKSGTPTDNPVIKSKMDGLRKKCILILIYIIITLLKTL